MTIEARRSTPSAVVARSHSVLRRLVIVAGGVWVLSRATPAYYFYDEWSLLRSLQVVGPTETITAGFNGHLFVLPSLLYRAQMALGLDSHVLVYGVFIASLMSLHSSLDLLLRRLGVEEPLAVAAAGLVTYFGVGSTNMLFEIQSMTNFVYALGFAAAALVIGPPGRWPVALISGMLVLAFAWDSAGAAVAAVFVGIVAFFVRGWRAAAAALAVPVLLQAWWLLFGAAGPDFGGSFSEQIAFGRRMLALAAGGLVAGGSWSGVVVLAAGAVAVAVYVMGGAARPVIATAAAGWAAALAMVVLTAHSRSSTVVDGDFSASNRYLQSVALYLVPALLPALVAVLGRLRSARELVVPVLAGLAVVVFASDLHVVFRYREAFEQWNQESERAARETLSVVRDGCPDGTSPDPLALPAGSISPQLSVELLTWLEGRGLYDGARAWPPSPERVALICP